MLATLFKDERCQQLPAYGILEKMQVSVFYFLNIFIHILNSFSKPRYFSYFYFMLATSSAHCKIYLQLKYYVTCLIFSYSMKITK